MPVSHRVSTPVFQTGTGSRTVTPDPATAVSELMIVPVGYQDSAATTITTPSGFTVQKSMVATGTLKTSVFSRVKQSGDSTFAYAPNQAVETSHLVLSIAGADAASLIVGGDGTRAASGGSTATTAPSIATTVPNTRVYVIATERTTANETVEATVNNGFTKIVHAFQNGTSAESLFLAYKDVPTPGAVGATTVTYQNSQGTNGYAVLIAVAPTASNVTAAGVASAASGAAGTARSRQAARAVAEAASAASGAGSTRMPTAGVVPASSSTAAAAATRLPSSGTAAAASSTAAAPRTRTAATGVLAATSGVAATAAARHSTVGVAIVASAVSGSASTSPPGSGASGSVAATATVSGAATAAHPAAARAAAVSTVAGTAAVILVAMGIATAVSAATGRATIGGVAPPRIAYVYRPRPPSSPRPRPGDFSTPITGPRRLPPPAGPPR